MEKGSQDVSEKPRFGGKDGITTQRRCSIYIGMCILQTGMKDFGETTSSRSDAK